MDPYLAKLIGRVTHSVQTTAENVLPWNPARTRSGRTEPRMAGRRVQKDLLMHNVMRYTYGETTLFLIKGPLTAFEIELVNAHQAVQEVASAAGGGKRW
jgi:hypothetical protein